MDGAEDQAEQDMRAVLAAEAGRLRHPATGLAHFLADVGDLPEDYAGGEQDEDLPGLGIAAEALEEARLRRAALIVAANQVIDRCVYDLADLEFDEDGRPDPDDAEDTFVFDRFPARYRSAYDSRFFRKVLVTAVKVAYDLADPDGGPPACIAEEIVRAAVIDEAAGLCDLAGLGQPWMHPTETLLEDTDFQYLFDETTDGLENDPALQAGLGIWVPGIEDWFTPFNPDRIVHPYTETTHSRGAEAHDLRRRLRSMEDAEHDALFAADVIDAPRPLAGLAAGSEVVELARRAATQDRDADLWIADPTNPEESFAELVRASTLTEAGGGWLCWEPHQDADTVRTDPVVALHPHRHFPIGDDTLWVDAAMGIGHYLAIPLGHVVSYRPDPDVRHRWSTRLLPGNEDHGERSG